MWLRLLLMASLSFAAMPPSADSEQGCASLSELAETVMLARQGGTPMRNVSQMIEDMISETSQPQEAAEVLRAMVLRAYEKPKFATYKNQTGTAVEFSNEYFLGCKRGRLPAQ